MMRSYLSRFAYLLLSVAAVVLFPTGLTAQWVEFDDQTGSRISADPNLVTTDTEEKDYAWGDVDRDGDIDLVVVRKEPVTTAGKRANVLLLNQDGVLTDRTADFAAASDILGDLGFLTPTNDRDVALVDLNNDGWLDMVTTTAISDGDPKHIGYPRIYMNQCCSVGGCLVSSCSTGNWLGYRYEDARIPLMLTHIGASDFNPCFCSVSAGDVTGDGYADLYFTDYDTSCGEAGSPSDFNDKLLINRGTSEPGYFDDNTEDSFVNDASGFPVSGFGASGGIAQFNQDDDNDILKQSSGFIGLAYNQAGDPGEFEFTSNPFNGGAYFVNYGDLNNDGQLDLVVSDDGDDRYLLSQGDDGDGQTDFVSSIFYYAHSGSGGPAGDESFAGNSLVADLNNDGHLDVLITDVDVDIYDCNRRMHIYKNLGGDPGESRILQEQTSGVNCEFFHGNLPSCIVTTIPADKLKGTHDVAVFDIDGDGYNDMVVGRCSGTEVYLNVPPIPPAGSTPNGDDIGGAMLTLSRDEQQITLNWGASCSLADTDYSIYTGPLGDFGAAARVAMECSTGGLTSFDQPIGLGVDSKYYLIAPVNQEFTGSLGRDSGGNPRLPGSTPCKPQSVGVCE